MSSAVVAQSLRSREDDWAKLIALPYPPHLLRTLWSEAFIQRGTDRATISGMLRHTSIISQEDYEVLATKIRLRQAMQALDAIVDQIHA